MKTYLALKISCPYCKNSHKIRFYNQSSDQYECPLTSGLFSVNSELTAESLGKFYSEAKNLERSIEVYEELLPLANINTLVNRHSKDIKDTRNNTSPQNQENKESLTTSTDELKTPAKILPSKEIKNDETVSDTQVINEKKIGKFNIDRKIGRGAFGVVFRALDSSLQRYVAIKVSSRSFDSSQIKKFKEEAAILAKFNHPNIVQVYEFGASKDNNVYIAMEFIDGINLYDFLTKRKNQGNEIFQLKIAIYFAKIADALDYVSGQNVYHQDLKPQNILVTNESQEPKILDFGMAKIGDQGFSGGTPYYMAPERFEEQPEGTVFSEIYSFGVMMYKILVDSYPYEGNGSQLLIDKCTKKASFSKENKQKIASELQNIVLKCLEIEKEHRYSSFQELNVELTKFISKKSDDTQYPYLWMGENEDERLIFPLKKRLYYIGRSYNNDLILLDKNISRLHLGFYSENDGVYIENLSTKNNVYVSGNILEKNKKVKLKLEDEIVFAEYVLFFIASKKDREKAVLESLAANEHQKVIDRNTEHYNIGSPLIPPTKSGVESKHSPKIKQFRFKTKNHNFSQAKLCNVNLRNVKLKNVELKDALLSRVILNNSDLSFSNFDNSLMDSASLDNTNFSHSTLRNTKLMSTSLRKSILVRANLRGADLSSSNLQEANLSKTNMEEVDLRNANLFMSNLQEAYLKNAILYNANLEGADLRKSHLEKAYLQKTNLTKAVICNAFLFNADLQDADLRDANLKEAYLKNAYLIGANLERANLEGANLEGANLEGANLEGANLEKTKGLTELQLSKCKTIKNAN